MGKKRKKETNKSERDINEGTDESEVAAGGSGGSGSFVAAAANKEPGELWQKLYDTPLASVV